jgi:hypothetical protein
MGGKGDVVPALGVEEVLAVRADQQVRTIVADPVRHCRCSRPTMRRKSSTRVERCHDEIPASPGL